MGWVIVDAMKMSRILAVPAIAAAALMTMTGCFQLPGSTPTDPGTSDPGTSDPGTTDPGTTDPGTEQGGELAGTTWSGNMGEEPVTMTFDQDGTVNLDEWNGSSFDDATDVWSVEGTSVTIYIGGIYSTDGASAEGVTFVGELSDGQMSLQGTADGGDSGFTLDISQG